MRGTVMFLLSVFIACSVLGKVATVEYASLNEFVDFNLDFFQTVVPLNEDFDGQLLFDEIVTEDGTYENVVLKKMGFFERMGNFDEYVNLDGMTNNVTGAVVTTAITLDVGKITAPMYFGLLSPLINSTIDLRTIAFKFSLFMSPSENGETCSLSVSIYLHAEDAILGSEIPFANNRSIIDFFQKTIVDYFNNDISTLTFPTKSGDCNPIEAYSLLTDLNIKAMQQAVQDRRKQRSNNSLSL